MSASLFASALLASFLGTTWMLQWYQMGMYPLWLWSACAALTVLLMITRRRMAIVMGCTVLGSMLALFTVQHAFPGQGTDDLEQRAGTFIELRGNVAEEPDVRQDRILYTLKTEQGRVLVTDTARWPRLSYGDGMIVEGTVELPKEQWYRNYLRLSEVFITMRSQKITPAGEWSGSKVRAGLITLKQAFEERINLLYPEPESSLLAGLLTGSRRGMPEDIKEAFQRAGLTHILAISGYNITIIISIIASLLFFVPQKYRLLPSIVAIVFFTLFVGASASVVRASIMGILGLLALSLHRITDARMGILWTAALMILWNPVTLWYDAGFHLSFLAVIGLMELRPLLEKPFRAIPETLGLRESLQMTAAAQLTAVPWVVYRFGVLSLICPIANLLVAPLIPLAMLFGFLATGVGFLSLALGRIVGFLGLGLLSLILAIAKGAAAIPFAAIEISSLGLPLLITYYVLLITTVVYVRRRSYRVGRSAPEREANGLNE